MSSNGRFLLLQQEDDALLNLIRDSVVELGLGLVRLEQGRRRLEELFQPQAALEEEDATSG